MPPKAKYDYIVAGGGCAGLSLIMHILSAPSLKNRSILLIEKDSKQNNDRTWCYWEKGPGFFDAIVHANWKKAWFHSTDYSSLKTLDPYRYKMIRGLDFYRYCHEQISAASNVTVLRDAVVDMGQTSEGAFVQTTSDCFEATYVFNSVQLQPPVLSGEQYMLLQHFKGWFIETATPAFKVDQPVLMDFRVNQHYGTTFVYVMPLSERRALVEYTLFTKSLLQDHEYEEGLQQYVSEQLKLSDYTVAEREFGIIPMTNYRFSPGEGNIIQIGTMGGQTKPSSGYTFRFIQKHSTAIVQALKDNQHPRVKRSKMDRRFFWYDSVLLHMLYKEKMAGSRIFSLLFKRNPIDRLFGFLDNESSLLQEAILLNTLPQWPFMKAGWEELMKPDQD
jgi:lycopene beta-cyclase